MKKTEHKQAGTSPEPSPQPGPQAVTQGSSLNRRQLLKTSSIALTPLLATACSAPALRQPQLEPGLATMLAAFAERIIPADANGPGALESGVVDYISRSLHEWNQSELPTLTSGLQQLNAAALQRHQLGFADLDASAQDALLLDMESARLAGFDNAAQIFNRLHRLCLEGMFSDPYYGGNRNYAGWDLIGYPGAVPGSTLEMQKMGTRIVPLHTSAYGSEHDGH